MKLKNLLTLIIFTLCLILLSAISAIVYSVVKDVVVKQVTGHLESVSEAKARRLEDIIQKNYEFTDAVSSHYEIIQSLREHSVHPASANNNKLSASLKEIKNLVPSIENVFIVSADGRITASTDSLSAGKRIDKEIVFIKTLLKGKYFDGFSLNEKNEIRITLSSIIVFDNKIIGIIIVTSNVDDFLSMTTDYTGLGKTGETILARREKDKIFYLTPLRFDSTSALRKTSITADTTSIVNLAIQKKKGIFYNKKDYRNADVIGAVRYFPETKWGMVTKIDNDEAFQPVRKLEKIILLTFLVFLVLSFATAYFTGLFISTPIVRLTESVKKIIDGDYSMKVKSGAGNEIGTLADYYNQMLEKQQAYLSMLNKSNESLERFAYIISHDLKSPLSSVKGLAELLKSNREDTDSGIYIDLINEKTDQMRNLIDGILEFSVKGKKNIVKPDTHVSEVLKQVMKMIDPPANIIVSISPDLPVVKYHKIPLIQIFQNLISNAIKYINRPDGLVSIRFEKDDHYYRFLVSDNGPGIRKEDQQRIFGLFETVSGRERKDSSGIGLSIVRQIIEENGGEIWVESEPGKGSTFIFTIPV